MTLYRQLIIYILLLFTLLFCGAWLAKLHSTRTFLVDQLQSHAQDTATSLGLSISQHMADNDMTSVETMINAVFDRGYYEVVRLTDTEGKILVDRVLPVKIENVPQWFITLFPLKTPSATANVMAGWFQAGTIYVQSHPGYAYKTLWETATRMTIWFVAAGIVVAIAGGIGLTVLLKPLKRVEQQAEALCKKEYQLQERLPRTKELRQVVEAMNRMTCKVRDMFAEQVSSAERLREHAYTDTVTGLGNRRYFDGQLTAHLEQREQTPCGAVLLVTIQDLKELNQQKGFQAGDALLKRVTELLRESTTEIDNCALARLTGGDFGVFLPEGSSWEAERLASTIAGKIGQLAAERLALSDNIGHVGAVSFDNGTTLGRLLSEADASLRAAQQAGPNRWVARSLTTESAAAPMGEQQWKEALEEALQERRIVLYAQSVVNASDRSQVLHQEVFSRLVRKDGSQFNAAVFLPFAERLQIVSTLDRMVIEEVMRLTPDRLGGAPVAINVSPTSLEDSSFRSWVETSLRSLPKNAPRLTFEFAEFSAVQYLERVKEFAAMVGSLGHGIGLDHYGQSFSNLGYLQSLRPDYVKIDRAYTGELKAEDSDSRFFISSLCSVAHSLDIAVIAEGVEDEPQWDLLCELNLNAMQGYLIERPKPITGEED